MIRVAIGPEFFIGVWVVGLLGLAILNALLLRRAEPWSWLIVLLTGGESLRADAPWFDLWWQRILLNWCLLSIATMVFHFILKRRERGGTSAEQ